MKNVFNAFAAFSLGLLLTAPCAAAQEDPAEGLYSYALVARPTATSAVISLVNGDLAWSPELRYRAVGSEDWIVLPVSLPANDQDNLRQGVVNLELTDLQPGTEYEFSLEAQGQPVEGGQGSFITQRPAGQTFRFVAMTDAHVNPSNPERNPVLRACADLAAATKPDFVLHLGDNMQTVGSSHGGPAVEPNHPNIFHIYFRQVLGALQSKGGQFVLNGNWEGENGWHPEPNRAWARSARMAIMPGPDQQTYPEGGSPNQDYYAFTWGDALFVCLNATGYTTINHEHTLGEGKADDWTLGAEQLAWLEQTLAGSDAAFKFVFTHHADGGNAGDEINSRYGRGGGRAAQVGEMALVHQMLQDYGVQAYFYGHDHVFTQLTVDGVNYICCGSAGAPWKFGTEETGYENYIPDSGFVVVDVEADQAVIRYLALDPQSGEAREAYLLEVAAHR